MRWLVVLALVACGGAQRTPDQQLALAERYFDHAEPAKALAAYEATGFRPDDERAWYVRYKIAYCYLYLGRREAAIEELGAVSHAPSNGTRMRAMLVETATRELADLQAQPAAPTTSSRR